MPVPLFDTVSPVAPLRAQPAFTFYASAEAIPATGATPVFCDVDPETMCVTAETVRAALA